MKHIKYISFLLLIILLTTNKVLAITASEPCYYMSDSRDFKAKLVVYTGEGFSLDYHLTPNDLMDLRINKVGAFAQWIDNKETIINWAGSGKTTSKGDTDKVKFPKLYDTLEEASLNGSCPTYLVFQHCSQYKVWGTNDLTMANAALDAIKSNSKCAGYKAQFKNSAGAKYTFEDYYGSAELKQRIEGANIELNCDKLFGDKDDAGEKKADGTVVRSASLAYIINNALTYVRIIVPILVILLGTLDLAKAVLSSKEDQMKKAQSDFMKRLIMGAVIFFVPAIVNVVMKLADIVWEGLGYSSCTLP